MDSDVARRARDDVCFFARVVCGAELWAHQREVAESPARYRVVCSGRQSGKSRLLAVLALHQAFSRAGCLVLIVSAGEVAATRLLAECSALAGSALLAGSVKDELKGSLSLSNGSQILSVPASAKQVRGWSASLLIVDEAGFLDQSLWQASEPVVIARPGSRVVLTSTPWGSGEHFFRALWRRGMDDPDGRVAGWHWPSSISPLVDAGLLEEIRGREPADYFAREYMAEWPDASGSFFSEEEISGAVADYPLLSPGVVAARAPWNYAARAGVPRSFRTVHPLGWMSGKVK
jgi:hypothetical protein